MNANDHELELEVAGATAALKLAAESARINAMLTNTDLILWKDGKILRITAAELRQQYAANLKANASESPKCAVVSG